MSPGKLVDEKDVGCQDKSGPGKIHEVILVNIRRRIIGWVVYKQLYDWRSLFSGYCPGAFCT